MVTLTIQETIKNLDNEIEQAIKLVNKERKANKGKWYTLFVNISGHQVGIKAYGTWIQRMKSDLEDSYRSSNMDQSVKEFNDYLEANFLSLQGR